MPILVMDASRAARASAIWRAVSGEWRGGEGCVCEEEVEGRVGEMEGGSGEGRVGASREDEASADMVGVLAVDKTSRCIFGCTRMKEDQVCDI